MIHLRKSKKLAKIDARIFELQQATAKRDAMQPKYVHFAEEVRKNIATKSCLDPEAQETFDEWIRIGKEYLAILDDIDFKIHRINDMIDNF